MNLIMIAISIVTISLLPTCKKKENPSNLSKIGEFYIYKKDIPLYEKPERGRTVDKLNPNDKVEIVETNIPDKGQGYWYKAIHGDNVGYIPLSEETNKNLFAFIFKSEQGRITASSLRIRETPDLKGKVLGAIPKNTIIDILGQGIVYEKIDDKYDTWLKIKSPEGIIGYSYAGYISKNLDPNSDDVEGENIVGYIEITSNPTYLFRPAGRETTAEDPAPCGNNMIGAFPQKGDIHKVYSKFIKDGATYYKVERAEDSHGCYESYTGWISEKEVTYIEDIYKYTYENYGSGFDKDFLDVINENVNNELNVKALKIEPSDFKVKEPGYTFYKVHGSHIYYKFNDSYHYAGDGGWGELVDINSDGTNEIISGGDCACMCSEAKVIIWNDGKLETIFQEYPALSLRWEIGKNYLTAIRSMDYSEESKGEETYYEIKDNHLLPLKKKPSEI